MKVNRAMRNILYKVKLNCSINSSLMDVVNGGFVLRDGCYFLSLLLKGANVSRENFPDRTGYECFVNSLHIEDYDPVLPLAQAIIFIKEIFSIWNVMNEVDLLAAIVMVDEFSVVTKFHVNRVGEQWLSSNIDDYDDPVFFILSSENVNFDVLGIDGV
ncbi:MAG: hypothetical protein V4807_10520 [Burkholderia gladioli]|uniref:hypothetical protein n=1 Tax=Burkholderia gladioli TaxID=28095 RepID=UPI00163FC942|nr:hypothetical protein [Burkholderia gladioli]